jgi:transposase
VHLSENGLANRVTVLKGDAPYERGYHSEKNGLLPPSKTSVKETQEAPAQKWEQEQAGRQAKGVREGVANAIWYLLWTGCQWKAIHREWFGVSASIVHERFQSWRRMGLFEKLMNWMVEHYAKESGGISWK